MDAALVPLYSALTSRKVRFPLGAFQFAASSPKTLEVEPELKRKTFEEADSSPNKKQRMQSSVEAIEKAKVQALPSRQGLPSADREEVASILNMSRERSHKPKSVKRDACKTPDGKARPFGSELGRVKPAPCSPVQQASAAVEGPPHSKSPAHMQSCASKRSLPVKGAKEAACQMAPSHPGVYDKIRESCASFAASLIALHTEAACTSTAKASTRSPTVHCPPTPEQPRRIAALQGPAAPSRMKLADKAEKRLTETAHISLQSSSSLQPGGLGSMDTGRGSGPSSHCKRQQKDGRPPLAPASNTGSPRSSFRREESLPREERLKEANQAAGSDEEVGKQQASAGANADSAEQSIEPGQALDTSQACEQLDGAKSPPPPLGLKIKGRRYVPEALLAALGLNTLSLTTPPKPAAAIHIPPAQDETCEQVHGSSPLSETSRTKKRKVIDTSVAPQTPQQEAEAGEKGGEESPDETSLKSSSRGDCSSRASIQNFQICEAEQDRPCSPQGQSGKKDYPQRLPAAAVAPKTSLETRPFSKRLKTLKANRELRGKDRPRLAPRTMCEARGVPTYFYPSEPPQDPEKQPTKRESEQDYVKAKHTASIWGRVQTKPRSGSEIRVMPVNENFHISSITDPNFRLGTKPFKYCFALKGEDAYEPQRIVGGSRQALRKFPEPAWLQALP